MNSLVISAEGRRSQEWSISVSLASVQLKLAEDLGSAQLAACRCEPHCASIQMASQIFSHCHAFTSLFGNLYRLHTTNTSIVAEEKKYKVASPG